MVESLVSNVNDLVEKARAKARVGFCLRSRLVSRHLIAANVALLDHPLGSLLHCLEHFLFF